MNIRQFDSEEVEGKYSTKSSLAQSSSIDNERSTKSVSLLQTICPFKLFFIFFSLASQLYMVLVLFRW